MGSIALKRVGVLIIIIAVLVGVCMWGYFIFSLFLNQAKYDPATDRITDRFGRTLTPAPWFVQHFLPFLTVERSVLDPMGPSGKWWLGWGWSILEWVGLIAIFCIFTGLFTVGQAVFESGDSIGKKHKT